MTPEHLERLKELRMRINNSLAPEHSFPVLLHHTFAELDAVAAAIASEENEQQLMAEAAEAIEKQLALLKSKDDLIRQLSERVAICSELLAKRADGGKLSVDEETERMAQYAAIAIMRPMKRAEGK